VFEKKKIRKKSPDLTGGSLKKAKREFFRVGGEIRVATDMISQGKKGRQKIRRGLWCHQGACFQGGLRRDRGRPEGGGKKKLREREGSEATLKRRRRKKGRIFAHWETAGKSAWEKKLVRRDRKDRRGRELIQTTKKGAAKKSRICEWGGGQIRGGENRRR